MKVIRPAAALVATILTAGVAHAADQTKPAPKATGRAAALAASDTINAIIQLSDLQLDPQQPKAPPRFTVRVVGSYPART